MDKQEASIHSKPHVCPHCKEVVPMIEVDVLGTKRKVQPACQCEADEAKRLQEESEKFQIKRDIEKMFAFSELGERFKNASLENFENREGAEVCKMFAQIFINEFEEWKEQSVSFWGKVGNGKTHLLAAIANALKAKGKIVVFIKMTELLDLIRSTFRKEEKNVQQIGKHDIMKALIQCDFLMIDDIGAENITGWVEEVIFDIIDARYARKKPILVTSNLSPDDLEKQIQDRSFDRLNEVTQFLNNTASSMRKKNAEDRMQAYMDKYLG
jgi:DNA replication protein DnaC